MAITLGPDERLFLQTLKDAGQALDKTGFHAVIEPMRVFIVAKPLDKRGLIMSQQDENGGYKFSITLAGVEALDGL